MKSKIKIVNKKKFVKMNVIIIMFVLVMIISLNTTKSSTEVKYRIDYISKGETLWDIANKEGKENSYYKDCDIRDIIYDLRKINNLGNGFICEGDEIQIPYF